MLTSAITSTLDFFEVFTAITVRRPELENLGKKEKIFHYSHHFKVPIISHGMTSPWYLCPRISFDERAGTLTKEENSRSILFHKGLCCLHDATLCERVPGSTGKKEENSVLLPRKGLCVLVTVQTYGAKAFLWGFAISVSLKKNNDSLVVLSVRFGFNLLNFH